MSEVAPGELNAAPGPFEQMQRMLSGHFAAQCLYVAAVLGIPDLVDKGLRTTEELATATQCDPGTLRRFLRTLGGMGLLTEEADGRFGLTPLGAILKSDAPKSLRAEALVRIAKPVWDGWGSLLDSIKTGEASFPKLYGMTNFQYMAANPDYGALFNGFMTAQSQLHNAAILDAYDFSGIHVLVDVGGNVGATIAAILGRYPALAAILFDLPEVIARAPQAQFGGRCRFVGGDMLAAVPPGGDAYLIKRVLMDESDDETLAILRNCRAAMNPGGKLLVIDPLVPSISKPHPNWLIDLHMLAMAAGRCRTEEQFRSLFDQAGFTLTKAISTRSPNFILEGVPG